MWNYSSFGSSFHLSNFMWAWSNKMIPLVVGSNLWTHFQPNRLCFTLAQSIESPQRNSFCTKSQQESISFSQWLHFNAILTEACVCFAPCKVLTLLSISGTGREFVCGWCPQRACLVGGLRRATVTGTRDRLLLFTREREREPQIRMRMSLKTRRYDWKWAQGWELRRILMITKFLRIRRFSGWG